MKVAGKLTDALDRNFRDGTLSQAVRTIADGLDPVGSAVLTEAASRLDSFAALTPAGEDEVERAYAALAEMPCRTEGLEDMEAGCCGPCRARRALDALSRPNVDEAPIKMILHCPKCGVQHIDEPDERTPDWSNPPHRSHLCHGCGCIWRPADVATEGVRSISTIGKADTWKPGAERPNVDEMREALERISRNEIEVFDAVMGCRVCVSMDAEEMQAVACVALDGSGNHG